MASMPLRQFLGALAYDGWRFERRVRGRWELIRNRSEVITVDESGHGVRCEWKWTSPVDYCRFVPGSGRRLMRAALAAWPIGSSPAPLTTGHPDVTFLIGHRGRARLPLLLATLGSIAAQSHASVECIVVEQAASAEVERDLPSWVRYIHQKVADDLPYNRAATFNVAAAVARGSILVLHDNDMLVPVRYAAELIRRCNQGWDALDLKRFIFYMTESDSVRSLRGEPFSISDRGEVIQNLRGGSIAITRAGYAAIGGFDETFVGWGGEDVEFWERAETLRTNRFGYLPIIHLWHAPQPEKLLVNDAPAVKRYVELARVPVEERIARLKAHSSPR
jgi:hypothetical protein